ncbi:MAG: DUF3018 family protein [Microthrixaceae bacterium]|nr:DUF3018 family protein [Microthrixaceae bacterium]
MSAQQDEPNSTGRVTEHRRRLRAQGLRPVQIWVSDLDRSRRQRIRRKASVRRHRSRRPLRRN